MTWPTLYLVVGWLLVELVARFSARPITRLDAVLQLTLWPAFVSGAILVRLARLPRRRVDPADPGGPLRGFANGIVPSLLLWAAFWALLLFLIGD